MISTIKEQVKELWKLCFNDSEEFTNLYFRTRYNTSTSMYIESGNAVISSLQILPYTFTYYGVELKAYYISGACTHPDYRNKGVMRGLLKECLARLSSEGAIFSFIIPAEDWLFDYYEKFGFASTFGYSVQDVTKDRSRCNSSKIEKVIEHRKDVYQFFNVKMHKRDFCVQHSEEDMEVIEQDMKIDDGTVFAAYREANIVGEAFVYKIDDVLQIEEILADTNKVKHELIQAVREIDPEAKVKLMTPAIDKSESYRKGMIRVVSAPKAIQLYAAHHPDLIMNIAVNDEFLSSNNSYYYLYKGKCMVTKEKLPGKFIRFNMTELSQFLFKDLHPYMSLMMD
jgi:predicted acetyltransferase